MMRRPSLVLGAVLMSFACGMPAASAQVCRGDCDGSGETTLGDVQTAFDIFLGTRSVTDCSFTDPNLEVDLGLVQSAFNEYLNGCGGTVTNFVSQFFVAGFAMLASVHQGAPPPPSGAAAPSVQSSGTVVNGGSSQVMVQSDEGINRVLLSVRTGSGSGAGSAGSSVPGFLEVDLPELVTSLTLVITTAQDVPATDFSWLIQTVDREGRVSDPAVAAVHVVEVGTGDLQVSVSWSEAESDVDLHVVEPSGEEIYYANRQSATGGTLDLDSNAACGLDAVKNENITWPAGQAPHGVYIVRLDYWSSCGADATPYVVTVHISDRAPLTFSGVFDGEGDHGAEGAGRVITEFTF